MQAETKSKMNLIQTAIMADQAVKINSQELLINDVRT